jgi:hypothetical protein
MPAGTLAGGGIPGPVLPVHVAGDALGEGVALGDGDALGDVEGAGLGDAAVALIGAIRPATTCANPIGVPFENTL